MVRDPWDNTWQIASIVGDSRGKPAAQQADATDGAVRRR
jgi:hypothetical protein